MTSLTIACRSRCAGLLVLIVLWLAVQPRAAAYDLHFDYTSFESTFGQAQFDVLNYPSINGNYMMTSTDNHRPEMVANGNALAQFYNNFLVDYNTQHRNGAIDAVAAADAIHDYTTRNSTRNGPRPSWLILNEISASLWPPNAGPPENSVYRQWVVDTVTRLHEHYGYNVVTFSPFQNPGGNDASWQALARVSYIGIECYLSGPEVWSSGGDYAARLAWAQGQYQASKNSYINRGIPADKLFLGEHFANNNAVLDNGTPVRWGRAGMASADQWDAVIQIRQDAIFNVGFEGFLAYNWGGNGMGVTQAEQIQHEYYYRARRVLRSQRPQWLSDAPINVNGTAIPLSWSQPLNWLGGVPNAQGAEANFWRTLTADRTITLDGDKTVGRLTFDSPFSYTIASGLGGRLVFSEVNVAASLSANQGDHTISSPVQLADDLNAAVNAGSITLAAGVSGPGGFSKSGDGVLALSGVLDYTGPTTVADGTLRLSAEFNTPGAGVTIGPQGVLEVGGGTVARDIDNDGLVRSPTFAGEGLRITGEAAGDGDYFGNVAFANRYSPGDGAAAVMMTNTVLESTNTLEMELAGPTPGSQHDHLALSGRLIAGGRLVVSFIDGFTPQPGDMFNLFDWSTFSGSFEAITLPELAGAVWDTSRLYADGTLSVLSAADFNVDGLVDAADLAAWTAGVGMIGSATHARGDADSDQDVDGADFLAWQRQIGAGGTVASVPEPQSGAGLAGMAAGMFAGQLRKRRPAMPTAESSSCRVPLHSVMTSRFMQALSHIAGNVQR